MLKPATLTVALGSKFTFWKFVRNEFMEISACVSPLAFMFEPMATNDVLFLLRRLNVSYNALFHTTAGVCDFGSSTISSKLKW